MGEREMKIYSIFVLNTVRFGLSGRTSSQTAIQEWFDTFGETEIVGDLFRNWSLRKRNGKKPEEKSLIKSVIRKEIIGETPPLPEKDPSPIPLIQARNFRPIFSDSIATTTDNHHLKITIHMEAKLQKPFTLKLFSRKLLRQ